MPTGPVVLIAGAGPSGLVAALSLVRNGVTVRIIDKSPVFHTGTRGAGIMPRTLEIFQFLGVIPQVGAARGLDAPPMLLYKLPGGVEVLRKLPPLMEQVDKSPSIPFNHAWFVSQADLEQVLRAELANYGIAVELGKELINFQQSDRGVAAILTNQGSGEEETVNVDYLIGADGAKGATRHILGLEFLGKTMDSDGMLVANAVVNGLSTDTWHIWKDPESQTVSVRPYHPAEQKFVVVITGRHADLGKHVTENGLRELFARHTGRTDVTFERFDWLSYFQQVTPTLPLLLFLPISRPNMRVVESFAFQRVFLVGDAAHVHSPHGGQGLNTSVQDSFNLAWKLASVCKGLSPVSLLQTYNEERLPVIAEMLKQVIGIYDRDKATGVQADLSRSTVFLMLGINYRWSSIVVDERRAPGTLSTDELKQHSYVGWDRQLSAGDRAPDASGVIDQHGRETTLFDLFHPAKHTIILFLTSSVEVGGVIKAIENLSPKDTVQTVLLLPANESGEGHAFGAGVLAVDKDGHARKAYLEGSVDEMLLFIIRPDGFVGGIVKSLEGVKKYFASIFH